MNLTAVLLTVVFFIYIASVLTNITLLLLIYFNISLHKPMYIFLFCLLVNGLIGSTAIWPKVMVILLTGVNTATYGGCLAQVFLAVSYGACNYTMFTVMAYDRLVSIFQPLQYHSVMTPRKVRELLLAAEVVPVVCVLVQVWLTSRMTLCGKNIHRIHCDNLSVTALSCGNSPHINQVTNLYGICLILGFLVVPVVLVLLSYAKIILFVLKSPKKTRRKAFETCSPHVIVFINFSFASLFSVVYNRVSSYLPREANVFLSVNYILFPPLLHPVIYGMKNQEIRQCLSKMSKRAVRII
ncbi:olfactory receptor 52E4-like [Engraulis encrasicolus]|uniref:olfactory receptor 52E4-like n=1 Tax=Engraulis encrasicolus TaxID=184585 RepID=UPI002FCF96EE